jgi:Flp pilus assembly protein TadG
MSGLDRRPRVAFGVRTRRWAAAEEGTAAIEFAIVAPVFLLIVFATVVFSIYLAVWLGVSHAAAEGARASVAGLTDTERQDLALSRVEAVISGYAPLLDPAKAEVSYPAAGTGLFSVEVTYPLAELNLSAYAPVAPVPTIAPSRTATVTTGGY